jgi:hypothetical protein
MSLEDIKGPRRQALIKLGLRWASPLVKAQANAFLGQLQTHQPTLETYGLVPEDVVELAGWEAQYPEQMGEREDKQLGNKLTSRLLKALLVDAGAARTRGRVRLKEAEPRLASAEGEGSQALHHVQEALQKTSRKPKDDPEAMASQLRLLAGALALTAVMDVVRPRGGEAALAALEKSAEAISQAVADMAQRTSTTALTERLDLLDGLIVERLREIGRVAKEAAKETGSPALAEAFLLKHLYA